MASAEVADYVRHVITEQNASVWLAQREGRAKDGDDRTSPALIRMLLNGEDGEGGTASSPAGQFELRVGPVRRHESARVVDPGRNNGNTSKHRERMSEA